MCVLGVGVIENGDSQKSSSSDDGNGDSSSKAQATQGTREHWEQGDPGQGRAKGPAGQSELLSGKSAVAGAVS